MRIDEAVELFRSFAAVHDGQWHWGLGDPDLGAVLVTGLYFLTAMICLVVARRLSLHAAPLIRPSATFSPGLGGEGTDAQAGPLIRPAATFSPGIGGEGTDAKAGLLIRPAATFSPAVGGEGTGAQAGPLNRPAATFSPGFGGEGTDAQASPLIRPAATFSPGFGGEGTDTQASPLIRPSATFSPDLGGEETWGEGRFWLVLAGMLFAMGVNKQADFQSLLTLYGREILHQVGLHDVRRPIQVAFIAGVALVAVVSVALCIWLVRRWSWPCRIAVAGLGIQAAFVVVRAASFHHVDSLLRIRLGSLKMNLLLESIGLFVILWSGIAGCAKARTESP